MAAEEATSMEAVARSHAGVRRFMRTTVEERAGGGKDSVVKWLLGGMKKGRCGEGSDGPRAANAGTPLPPGGRLRQTLEPTGFAGVALETVASG
jgi:hypothetical protein